MRLLLDTHALIWWLTSSKSLDPQTLRALEDRSNRVYVSVASFWEMAIKAATGRLSIPPRIMVQLSASGVTILPIETPHAWRVATLPPLHKDPFDRLLVAQAMHEGLTLVTRDPWVAAYPIVTLRA